MALADRPLVPEEWVDRLHETLAMAEAADVGGLDLVTIQDHPYQAKHLDARTLLSVIAARSAE